MDMCINGKKERAGIALVIVLGFLSILTLMAVGFAISMILGAV